MWSCCSYHQVRAYSISNNNSVTETNRTTSRGFAAEVPDDDALESVRTQDAEHAPTIEDDKVISIGT